MAAGMEMVQAYEKTSDELSYPSVVHFTGHVQLKGVRPQTVEAYEMMVPLLACWAGQDPEELNEERVREFFLHLLRERQYSSHSIRQARVW